MDGIYCAHCKTTLSAAAVTCPHCGSPAVMVSVSSERSTVFFAAAFVLALLLVMLVAWIRY